MTNREATVLVHPKLLFASLNATCGVLVVLDGALKVDHETRT